MWPSKNLFGGGSRLTGSTLDEAQAGRVKTKAARVLRTFAARSPVGALHHHPTIRNRPRASVSLLAGHPSVEQLMAGQGTGPVTDVSVLHGDFWPVEESIENFLATLHQRRGHS